jgi:hypothetical protein
VSRRGFLVVDLARLGDEAQGSCQILKLKRRLSQVEDLSDRYSVLAIQYLIGSNELSAIFFELFASFSQGKRLLRRRSNSYLNGLVVLHLYVVLIR